MGKKKEKISDSTSSVPLPAGENTVEMMDTQDDASAKKTKRHKRKKSSKDRKHPEKHKQLQPKPILEQVDTVVIEDEDQEIFVDDVDLDVDDCLSDSTSGAKLLIKMPDTPGDKNLKVAPKGKGEKSKTSSSSKKSAKKKDGSKDDDDTDTERWLDAIESGKLEEVDDELKRIKNPRLMTARQRALMEKRSDGVEEGFPAIPAEPLLALPTGFKEKVLTEEMLAKKAIKSKRRREQAIEKREEDKKKTVDRLLKKQDSKASKLPRWKDKKQAAPMMTFLDNRDGIFLCFPVSMTTVPIATQVEREPPKPVICNVEGCFNLKKYSCSKTQVPLCSLECYKKNLLQDSVT